MKFMAELHHPGIGKLERNFLGASVAPVTASTYTKSNIVIMAGTAGAVFLHCPHIEPSTGTGTTKYSVMAVIASIHFRGNMRLVRKQGITCLE